MRRLSFVPCARSVAVEGRASSVLIRGYAAQSSLQVPVDVNEDLPVFKDQYQHLLKKFGAKEGSETAQDLKELAKVRVVGLEGVKVQYPQEYNKFVAAVEEVEDIAANYVPQIRPTVDEAFDSKNHPFITDPIGAEIFQAASDVIDRQNYLTSVLRERLGITARKLAEYVWDQAEQGVLDPTNDAPRQVEPRGDLPDWIIKALENTNLKKVGSKKELLDAVFPTAPLNFSTPVSRRALAGDKQGAVDLKLAELAADEGLEPGTPAYADLKDSLSGFEPTPLPETEELQNNENETNKKLAALRGKFEELLTPEPRVYTEEMVSVLRYTGENGIARRAINGFLLNNAEPSDDDKLKFMKTLREALRQRRKAHGFVLRELYPSLNLSVDRNVDDKTLVTKFNEYAASL